VSRKPIPPAASPAQRSFIKRLLRVMPRRALLHKYPFVGRFAHRLRRHACLWSFRRDDVRRAYYVGSVLAFLPLLGIQMPIAIAAAVVLRSNVMVTGGLQFLTNPVTAAPIYYATHRLGQAVLDRFNGPPARIAPEDEIVAIGGAVATTFIDPLIDNESPRRGKLSLRVREALQAMTIGGILVGLMVGGILDAVDFFARKRKPPLRPPPPTPRHGKQPQPLSAS